MSEFDKKLSLIFAYLDFSVRKFQFCLHFLYGFSFVIFFGGLISWPFYSDGWKLSLSAIAIFMFYFAVNSIFQIAIRNAKERLKFVLESNDDYLEIFLQDIRKNKKFIKKFKMVYGEYLVDLSQYTLDEIAEKLIGKTICINNATVKLTKIPQIIYYLGEIREKPNGLDSLHFSNGIFTDQVDNGQTLKQYLIYHI